MAIREPTYFILAALLDGPLHGYGIVRSVERLSHDRVRLAAGTLYGALDRLVDQELIEPDGEEIVDGRTRRYYQLTARGQATVHEEAERLRQAASVVQQRTPKLPSSQVA
jgi:DNA-binding PadR family transcriptional regulator